MSKEESPQDAILLVLHAAKGPILTFQISARSRVGIVSTRQILCQLVRDGLVTRKSLGIVEAWELTGRAKSKWEGGGK